ncbi:unnamed protein product [Prunus armeniaca]
MEELLVEGGIGCGGYRVVGVGKEFGDCDFGRWGWRVIRWGGGWWVVISQQQREIRGEGEGLGGCLGSLGGVSGSGGEELGFWVHRNWGGGWLLDGFGWRVVMGWVWVLELEGGGHGGMERERERERDNIDIK